MENDIIYNQSGFVNMLLDKNDIRTIQYSLQNCIILINEITTLEHIIDKLYYSVKAGLYKNSLSYANNCKIKFDTFSDNINKYYLGKLHSKYSEIIDLIKKKLLDNFDIKKDTSTNDQNDQIDEIIDLLDILNENDRNIFMKDLAHKICSEIPKEIFSINHKQQLLWIFHFLEKKKYILLDKWNVNQFIVDEWTIILVENIMKDDIKNYDIKILKGIKTVENKIKSLFSHYNDNISCALDVFCKNKLNELFSKYTLPIISDETEDDLLKCVTQFIFTLKNYDNRISDYINNRNIKIVEDFYASKLNIFLSKLVEHMKNNSVDIFDIHYIEIITKTSDYLNNNIGEIKLKYANIEIDDKLNIFKKNFDKIIYAKYKDKIIKLIDQSLNKYQKNIFKTITKNTENLIGNIINMSSDKDTNIDDVSKEIIELCNIVEKFNDNNDIISYLMNEINKNYADKICPDTLMKYDKTIISRLFFDIIYIKNKFKKYADLLNDVENKIKFLDSDIIHNNNNPIIINQFKLFYKDHNKELFKKILKFKEINQTLSNQLIKIYDNKL